MQNLRDMSGLQIKTNIMQINIIFTNMQALQYHWTYRVSYIFATEHIIFLCKTFIICIVYYYIENSRQVTLLYKP